MNDPLANALSNIWNAEKVGKKECIISISSVFIENILKILKSHNYIKDFKVVEGAKKKELFIFLSGKINKCKVIKPRYNVKLSDYEKFEKRYLPAKDFGIIFVSTSKGMMTHIESKNKKLGGRLIAYCY